MIAFLAYGFLWAANPAASDCHVRAVDLPPIELQAFQRRGKPRWLNFSQSGVCLTSQAGEGELAVLVDLAGLVAPAQIDVEVRSQADEMLAPEVLVLDAQGGVVVHHRFDAFRARGVLHRLSLFVNESTITPRYVLLRPDADWLARTDTLVRGHRYVYMVPIGAAWVPIGNGMERERHMSYGTGGEFRVQWQPYAVTQLEPGKR